MRCLIIEDDPFKLTNIRNLLSAKFPQIDITSCVSYMSGINKILEDNFDLILLDMSLPLYDESNTSKAKNFGGKDILKEMKRRKKSSNIKVITQYNEFDDGSISMKDLDAQLRKIYPSIYQGFIHYETKKNLWQAELAQYIQTLIKQ